jgi:hypothetical protein
MGSSFIDIEDMASSVSIGGGDSSSTFINGLVDSALTGCDMMTGGSFVYWLMVEMLQKASISVLVLVLV